jgi:hypothetical protein
MALLYAAVFFLAGIFPSLVSRATRVVYFGSVVQWLPGAISIPVALFVAAVVTNSRLSPRAAAAIAIVFEIVSSYGIAAAELLQPQGLDFRNATRIGSGSPSGRSSSPSSCPRRPDDRCSRRSPRRAACR